MSVKDCLFVWFYREPPYLSSEGDRKPFFSLQGSASIVILGGVYTFILSIAKMHPDKARVNGDMCVYFK